MRARAGDLAAPAAVFAASLVLYLLTSARAPGWVDATLILDSARELTLGSWVNTHNLFDLLGHAWLLGTPWLDPNRSLTIFCAFMGSCAVLLLYLGANEATGNRTAAIFAAAAVSVSHSLWWHSTTIEVYTLNSALIAAFIFLAFGFCRRGGAGRLYGAFFAAGLGVSNHVLMGLFAPAFLVLLAALAARRRIGIRQAIVAVLCGAAGASLFLFVLTRDVVSAGGLRSTLHDALGGNFLSRMFPAGMPADRRLLWAANYLFLVVWNYPSAAIVFAVRGLPRLATGRAGIPAAAFFFTGLGAQVVWSANYLIWDMWAFSLPVYVMLAIPLAFGFDAFLRGGVRRGRWVVLMTLALPVMLYTTIAHWPGRERTVDRYIAFYPEVRAIGGYWDPVEYVFDPVKSGHREVEQIALAWEAVLPPNAQYWDDDAKMDYPLRYYYQPVRQMRPDVTIHHVFGFFMDQSDALSHAHDIKTALDLGAPVFISSLDEPEHEILVQLSHLMAENTSQPAIRSLGGRELADSFPGIRVIAHPLGGKDLPVIYELKVRPPAG
jgi:hypothetical protein